MGSANRYQSRSIVSEPFHDKTLLEEVWGENWGVPNDIGNVKKVLMHRPGQEIFNLPRNAKQIEAGSVLSGDIKGRTPGSNTSSPPNLNLMQSQHDSLVQVLQNEGIEVVYLEGITTDWPERMFTRDLGMVIPGGVILPRLALYLRYGETLHATKTYSQLGMPILGCIQGDGFVEGGSFTMLDNQTALIGRSERVNKSGIEQLRNVLSVQNIELISIDLPSTIIHLDEAFLLLDRQKALVNKSLLPFWFLDELHQMGFELLHVDPNEPLLAINVLPIAPGKVVCPASGVNTMRLLEQHGLEVIAVDVSEFEKAGGAIHCLTLPLMRDPLS
ncbi:dimethylarginine dimethylaminohydrolase family protein [Desertibacillus haloalkaliphilus]|uniref:dimethylarginine dimethylaminohydrolase family protein n=1 Tax=Desertibacillus haloalkaliphilus TaxID=1328930 RepID=UPI001C253805|nr:arginine deiminase family protein [Desertibacillus haloalkaliphilus]MBU8906511.1 amidinotransferase [Desertibacillus haloalkaliphilus]